MRIGQCDRCEGLKAKIEALESHNAYLKKLVDKLLAKSGVSLKKEKEEPEAISEAEKIIANGGEVYGEEM